MKKIVRANLDGIKVHLNFKEMLGKKCSRILNNEIIVNLFIKKVAIEHIKEICFDYNNDGYYVYNLYADSYDDGFDEKTIKKILNSENPKDKFYEMVTECYSDYIDELYRKFVFEIEQKLEGLEYDYDFLLDYVYEKMVIRPPYDDFLDKIVCSNLVLDTGDGNLDFTCNNIGRYDLDDIDDEIYDNSSIIWLAKQQGYTKEDVINAIEHSDYKNSRLLKSIDNEVQNTTTSMNALVFLISTTFGKILDYVDSEKDKNSFCVVGKSTKCGLVDFWNGAGSLIEIELEKDVLIPVEYIDSLSIDGDRGSYGIKCIYGVASSYWNGEIEFKDFESLKKELGIKYVPKEGDESFEDVQKLLSDIDNNNLKSYLGSRCDSKADEDVDSKL